jgi:hypothetical protein
LGGKALAAVAGCGAAGGSGRGGHQWRNLQAVLEQAGAQAGISISKIHQSQLKNDSSSYEQDKKVQNQR